MEDLKLSKEFTNYYNEAKEFLKAIKENTEETEKRLNKIDKVLSDLNRYYSNDK